MFVYERNGFGLRGWESFPDFADSMKQLCCHWSKVGFSMFALPFCLALVCSFPWAWYNRPAFNDVTYNTDRSARLGWKRVRHAYWRGSLPHKKSKTSLETHNRKKVLNPIKATFIDCFSFNSTKPCSLLWLLINQKRFILARHTRAPLERPLLDGMWIDFTALEERKHVQLTFEIPPAFPNAMASVAALPLRPLHSSFSLSFSLCYTFCSWCKDFAP